VTRPAGKQSAQDAIARQWAMLRHLPRYPQKVTAATLKSRLEGDGHDVSKRTIERDLQSLATPFPLLSDEREKPYGWSWKQDAPALSLPGLSPMEALIFHLAARHLQPLLPASMLKALSSHFRVAEGKLAATAQARAWASKVRVVPATQPLIPPKVDSRAYAAVTEALLTEHQLKVSYRRRGDEKPKSYVLNPKALVQRGAATYLVATVNEHSDPLLFALHRFSAAECMEEPARNVDGFEIDAYIESGALGFGGEGDRIALEVLIDPGIAKHLEETPLASDQALSPVADKRVRLKATVVNTPQLRWWLLGFGEGVEVVRPKSLRDAMAKHVRAMARLYS